MTEVEMLICSIVFFALALSFFICMLVILKNRKKYFDDVLIEIENKTREYFTTILVEDKNLFPYHDEVVAGVSHKFKSEEYDELTKIRLKKGYTFAKQKVIFIINNDLNYHKTIIRKNNKEYLVIDDNIKQLEILISSYRPSHYMLKYTFKHDKEGVKYEVEEVKYDR